MSNLTDNELKAIKEDAQIRIKYLKDHFKGSDGLWNTVEINLMQCSSQERIKAKKLLEALNEIVWCDQFNKAEKIAAKAIDEYNKTQP